MKRALALSLLTVLCACKAHMLETRGDALQLFKTGREKPGRGGVIRYLVTGLPSFKKAREADAAKQMTKFCGGPYAVSAQGPRSKLGASVPIPKGSLEFDEYWYVAFDCQARPKS